MTRYYLNIKGSAREAIDSLKRHGIDSFSVPVTQVHGAGLGPTYQITNVSVGPEYASNVTRWYKDGLFAVGSLLHYSIVD